MSLIGLSSRACNYGVMDHPEYVVARLDNERGVHRISRLSHLADAGIAQLVEHDLAKVGVASSSLVSRSKFNTLQRRVSDTGQFLAS